MGEYPDRFAKRKDELEYLYRKLYGDGRWYLDQLEQEMASFDAARSMELKELDKRREANSGWYKDKHMLGVTMYVDLFAGNLLELEEKIPYLKEMGVTYLHLMPILKMPQTDNDGGYAVEDFNLVDSRFGSNGDLENLTRTLRKQGISLCLDFVMNHTSSSHEWAKLAQEGDKEFQLRYLCYPDRTIPDQFEKTVPQVFPGTAPGNFVWSEKMGMWVFKSFYPTQWDLNYRNPVVLNEMIYSMLRLSNLGVEVFRLDAVPYLWKELGTTCRNLPQVHVIIRIIRLVLECVCPSVILKGEVVMAPGELAAYFGTLEKPECHLLYNVSTMVNLWAAMASQDARLLKFQIDDLLSLPSNCDFLNYLRCHDDIGWGLDEDKERQLGIDPLGRKIFLYRFYEGKFPGSYARGELYNYDAISQDARSCGTTASLCGVEAALQSGDKADLEMALRRFMLLYSTMFSLRGFPMISSGDEIGQLNDYSYKKDSGKRNDSRNLHRSGYDWRKARLRHDLRTIEGKVWSGLENLREKRVSTVCFDSDAMVSTWDAQNSHVFALRRMKDGKTLLVVSNFSDFEEQVKFAYFIGEYRDMFSGRLVTPGWGFTLKPLEYLWLEQVGDQKKE
ncbi:MAG: amylosucrase [Sphaerochaetaceae bacterium]